ncbi:MAG: hypothetical protein ACFB4I_17500 [Cyanophyceae cyanobacterium]
MSALATNQIPTSVDTAERLLSYSALILARVNPDLRVLEVAGRTQKAVEVVVTPADDGSYRLVIRASLALAPDFASDTATPFFLKTQELSNIAVPSGFLVA